MSITAARSTPAGLRSWQQRHLKKHSVWGRVSRETARGLRRTVERAVQAFLEEHPELFAAALLQGHTRCVRSQVRFGAEYIPDFMLADVSSISVRWTLVELESPRAKLSLSNGHFSREARNAIHQISAWRNWLDHNRGYAARVGTGGLGLVGIGPDPPGLVLIGRRGTDTFDPDDGWLRAQTRRQRDISVHTYDWLLDLR